MQRVTRNASKNKLPGKEKRDEKHLVFALDDTDKIQRQAREWVKLKNQYYQKQLGVEFKPYEEDLLPYRLCIASLTDKPIFRNIKPNEVLYVFCHGFSSNDEKDCEPKETQLWLKNFDKDSNDSSTKKAYNPADFMRFLIEQSLNIKHQKLKIAACYSDKFAIELFKISRTIYKDMSIIGYKGQLIVAQGPDGEKFAGLYPDTHASLLIKSGDHVELSSKPWYTDPNNQIKFRASKNRVICNAEEQEIIELKEQKVEGKKAPNLCEHQNEADQQTSSDQQLINPDLNETAALERLNITSENKIELELISNTTNKTNTRERFGWIEPSQHRSASSSPRRDASSNQKPEPSDSVESPKSNDSVDAENSNEINTNKSGLGH